MLGSVRLVLLGMLLSGQFSRVSKEELARVQAALAQSQAQVQQFWQARATLAKERPELTYKYFPYASDP